MSTVTQGSSIKRTKVSPEFVDGTADRYDNGKLDFSHIQLKDLEDEVKVWMVGEMKYARHNWRKGMAWSKVFASLMRHLTAWQQGQDVDAETGLPHIAHAMCNLRMLQVYATSYPQGDDRLKEGGADAA